MIYKTGDLLEAGIDHEPGNIIAIPANCRFKGGGKLVMGAGFAKQIADQYGLLPELAAMAVRDAFVEPDFFGFCFIPGTRFALFQSKVNPAEPSNLELIERSVRKMVVVIKNKKIRTNYLTDIKSVGPVPFDLMHLPMPGIGLGGLDRDDVAAILEKYLSKDPRFVIWEK